MNRFQQFHDESIKKYNQWVKKKEEQQESFDPQAFNSQEGQATKKAELNLNPDYWSKKFLYPYSLDTGPLKIQENNIKEESKMGSGGNL